MCGCRKAAPKAQAQPVATPQNEQLFAALSRSGNLPVRAGTTILKYMCNKPEEDLSDVPTGSKYRLTDMNTVVVYPADVNVLLNRTCVDGPAFERIN